ncbi:MAG: hypothetical protein REI11_19110 [Patulibacter sp.]|nr:hypothetical protein [Patulibacter sp.]
MHPALKATMAAATLALLTAAASDPASARSRSCAHAGHAYSASGTLASDSTLAQVAGATTKRTSDDRWSGTLDVDVTQAGRERALGLHAYVVTNIRLRGASGGTLPATGTKIKLTGLAISASAARRCGIEEPVAARPAGTNASAAVYADPADDTSDDASVESTSDDSTDAPAVVTGVQITSVKFGGKAAAGAHAKKARGGDDATDDDTSDSGDDDPADGSDGSGDASAGDPADDGTSPATSDDQGDDGDNTDDDGAADAPATTPATTPKPTPTPTPAPTTPAATTPAAGIPVVGGHRPRR